jgi:hypothetical protein
MGRSTARNPSTRSRKQQITKNLKKQDRTKPTAGAKA